MNEPADDKALDEYLGRNSQISQRYRALAEDVDESVPPELDQLILAQAQRAIEQPVDELAALRTKRRRLMRWSIPAALAASMVLVVSIVIRSGVEHEVRGVTEYRNAAPAAPISAEAAKHESTTEVTAQESAQGAMPEAAVQESVVQRATRQSAHDAVVAPVPQQDAAPVYVTPATPPPAPPAYVPSPPPASSASAMPQAAPPPVVANDSAPDPKSASSGYRREAPATDVEEQIETQQLEAKQMERRRETASMPAASAAQRADASPPPTEREAPSGSSRELSEVVQTTQSAPVAAGTEAANAAAAAASKKDSSLQDADKGAAQPFPKEQAASTSASYADIDTARLHANPDEWLKHIRQLRKDGKSSAADEQWERFRAKYPAYHVDESDTARASQRP